MARTDTAVLTLERYQPSARAWVAAAQREADEAGHREVYPMHVLLHGLGQPEIAAVFERAGASPDELLTLARAAAARLPRATAPAYLSAELLELLRRAEREALRRASDVVTRADLLTALTFTGHRPTRDVLRAFRLGPGGLAGYMVALREELDLPQGQSYRSVLRAEERVTDWVELARRSELDPVIGRVEEARRVLTVLERRSRRQPVLVGEVGVGKSAVLRGLAQRMARGDVPTSLARARLLDVDIGMLLAGARARNDVLARLKRLIEDAAENAAEPILMFRSLYRLLGSGISSTNVADYLASALAAGRVRVVATATFEQWKRIEVDEPALAQELSPIIIHPADAELSLQIVRALARRYEAHHRVSVSEGALRVTVQLAQRYLSQRFLPESALDLLDETAAALRVATDGLNPQLDAATSELFALRAQQQSLSGANDERSRSMFAELGARIDELSPEVESQREAVEARREAVAGLRQIAAELSEARALRDEAKAKEQYARVGELEHRTISELEQRLKEAEAKARQMGFEEQPVLLMEHHVAATLQGWTGIAVDRMLEKDSDKLLRMEERLSQRVVGQPEAVQAISRAVRRGRVGLRDPRRPIGSFLFVGPTGVGKTELAKALAEFLFDDERALTRLDMSEFMERHMAQRLLGAPPGYADSEQGGVLTEAVRRRPYSVLLFDEVEKAHQDVFNLLLQVLDDGRLTDGRGQLADFTNTVIILTSNIGSERIVDVAASVFESEEGRGALQDVLQDRLHAFFRPEFINRLNDIVVFRPLGKPELRSIVGLQLERVARLLQNLELSLEVTEAAKLQLVELGYDPALGARPVHRSIIRHLQDPLAEELLRGNYSPGDVVKVDFDGELRVLRASPPD